MAKGGETGWQTIGQPFRTMWANTTTKRIVVVCRCRCGTIRAVLMQSINAGISKTCGCVNPRKLHGLHNHPLYSVWANIKDRCYRKTHPAFDNYGGRGIRICRAWKNDPAKFIRWAIKNGWKKGLDIDRKKNDRGYAPWNCRFVTRRKNQNNKRTNVLVKAFGKTQTITRWARRSICVVSIERLYKRIQILGWKPEKALVTPARYWTGPRKEVKS